MVMIRYTRIGADDSINANEVVETLGTLGPVPNAWLYAQKVELGVDGCPEALQEILIRIRPGCF